MSKYQVYLIGREAPAQNGKRLMYLLGRLNNYGVGRLVYRSRFEKNWPEPTFYVIDKVEPNPKNVVFPVRVIFGLLNVIYISIVDSYLCGKSHIAQAARPFLACLGNLVFLYLKVQILQNYFGVNFLNSCLT